MTENPKILKSSIRSIVLRAMESQFIQRAITLLIIINAAILALETSELAMQSAGEFLLILDRCILVIFVIEILFKWFGQRLAFFKDPWNVFDTIVISIALVPVTESLTVLRALRILRVLRLISVVPSLRRVVGALLHALPGMGSVILLLLIIYFVFSVMATKLFGGSFPDWFGTIGASAYTLFQIMTLESWSMGIVRPVMQEFSLAWAFFVPFILVTSFAVLNLFIGIIVDAMQTHAKQEDALKVDYNKDPSLTDLRQEIQILQKEIISLREKVQDNPNESKSL